ncbi:MAG: maltose alpha-D-glucosyltransferase [Fibrobacteria bacterium]|nr:maltose alpha-D-glucosyltransferase [Fibrobacteria bacterium]
MKSAPANTDLDTDDLWYRDAVIYELHVRAFQDSNGDGIGDFQGLRRRLPWLKDLGVTCLWLLPFYPSPLRDDGYDIADYMSIHPDYGTMRDFRAFLSDAHKLGLRVITELVVNHTSDQHPWFQKARQAPKGSSDRQWYVWNDDPKTYSDARIIFTDTETSNWTWDPVAGQYFWHRFFSHQPDLNYDHPPVKKAVEKVLKFWLDAGVDGVRLDAVPYLVERDGTNCENLPETHQILKDLRSIADRYSPRRIFLAEANQWPQDVIQYFGEGDECHMAYNFPLMPRLFMALAQEDTHPVSEILSLTPAIPEGCQWALFLRNHDELTLEMVTDKERDYMYRAYATDPRMRINVGIRRRLAPLVGNSRPRIEMLNALLLSLPGTPVLYYGDEIGMGDNIYLGDRNGVRTPMHWSPDRNAGFSSADFAKLYSPLVVDGPYGYQGLNVEAQERDLSSLLHWMRRILSIRSSSKSFGRGGLRFVDASNRRVLAFLREYEGETILVVANFSRHPQPAGLQLSEFAGCVPVELFGGAPFPEVGVDDYPLALAPHGFYWFRLETHREKVERIRTGKLVVARDSLPLIEVDAPIHSWWQDSLALIRLQETALANWLPNHPWYAPQGESFESCAIRETAPVRDDQVCLLVHARRRAGGEVSSFGVFLSLIEGEEAELALRQNPTSILARLRGGDGREVLLADSLAVPSGLDGIELSLRENLQAGKFHWEAEDILSWGSSEPRTADTDRRHPIVHFGDRILKVFHRLQPGIHPGEEILRHLDKMAFPHAPSVLGGIRHGDDRRLLALLLQNRPNQGMTKERFEEACLAHLETLVASAGTASDESSMLASLDHAALLGKRVAELHLCLSSEDPEGAFGVRPWDTVWQSRLVAEIHRRLDRLETRRSRRQGESPVVALRDQLGTMLVRTGALPISGSRIRCHGDLHLGQILWNQNDFVFLDFEGDISTPIEKRRVHHSPLRDLAAIRVSLAMVATRSYAQLPPSSLDELLLSAAHAWSDAVWRTLVAGYQTAISLSLLPSEATLPHLLRLHVLDRLLAQGAAGRIDDPLLASLIRRLVLDLPQGD